MSHPNQSMRALLGSSLVAAACLSLAAPALALAQQAQPTRPGETMGLRYLTWSGKPAQTQTPEGLRRPVSLPAPVAAATPTPRSSRYGSPTYSGPTPASAWTPGPTATPAHGLRPAQPPQPTPVPTPEPRTAPLPPEPLASVQPQAQPEFATAPGYAPARSTAGRPMRANDAYLDAPAHVRAAMQPASPPVVEAPAYDPMAPRADAPIFRMAQARQQEMQAAQQAAQQAQQPAPESHQPEAETHDDTAPRVVAQAAPVRPGDAPRQGPRYYSLHRDAGHEPDPVVLPESVYIGGESMDLAEPPPAPVVQRTVNGRVQTIATTQDPALP